MTEFTITREIGIDAGHRVTYHGSKCRNLHGHRYTVQATCAGPLYEAGASQGMVLDFGFLKEEMMAEIDAPCDHGLILWWKDPLTKLFLEGLYDEYDQQVPALHEGRLDGEFAGKLYLVPFVPTAENLAKHWFERLAPKVLIRSGNQARLIKLRVLETPNCWAEYGPSGP